MKTRKIGFIFVVVSLCIALIGCSAEISVSCAMDLPENGDDTVSAGSQRSDPKSGDSAAFPLGRGPQGNVVRIDNFVRCVRSIEVE